MIAKYFGLAADDVVNTSRRSFLKQAGSLPFIQYGAPATAALTAASNPSKLDMYKRLLDKYHSAFENDPYGGWAYLHNSGGAPKGTNENLKEAMQESLYEQNDGSGLDELDSAKWPIDFYNKLGDEGPYLLHHSYDEMLNGAEFEKSLHKIAGKTLPPDYMSGFNPMPLARIVGHSGIEEYENPFDLLGTLQHDPVAELTAKTHPLDLMNDRISPQEALSRHLLSDKQLLPTQWIDLYGGPKAFHSSLSGGYQDMQDMIGRQAMSSLVSKPSLLTPSNAPSILNLISRGITRDNPFAQQQLKEKALQLIGGKAAPKQIAAPAAMEDVPSAPPTPTPSDSEILQKYSGILDYRYGGLI